MLGPSRLVVAWVVGSVAVLGGCNGDGQLDPPGFRGVVIQKVQPDFNRPSVTVDFGLKFRYVNPFPFDLRLPPHEYTLRLDGAATPQITLTLDSQQVVPAGGHKDVTYVFPLVLGEGTNVPGLLGRDVPYEFAARYTLSLPGNIPDRQVRLAFADTVRLPKFPTFAPAPAAPRISLIGDIKTIDIKAFRDPMLAPGNHIAATIDAIPDIGPLNPQAFVDGWNKFKSQVPDVVLNVAESRITGLRLEMPLRITNPNQFEIEAPTAAFSINPTAGMPRSSNAVTFAALRYASGDPVLGPNETRTVTLVTELRWSSLTQTDPIATLLKLTSGDASAVQLKLNADVSVDLGYGPVRAPIRLDVNQIMLGNP